MANRPTGKAVTTLRRRVVPTELVAHESQVANENRYRAQIMEELTRIGRQVDELRARIEALEEAAP